MKHFFVAALILGFSQINWATTIIAPSDQTLVASSDQIVLGSVTGNQQKIIDGTPYTCTTLDVIESIKGDSSKSVTTCEIGGSLGSGRFLKIFGSPEFQNGETSLLFLKKSKKGHMETNLMSYGRLRQSGSGSASFLVRDSDNFLKVNSRSGQLEAITEQSVNRQNFIGYIKDLVKGNQVASFQFENQSVTSEPFNFLGDRRWFEGADGKTVFVNFGVSMTGDTNLGADTSQILIKNAFAAWTQTNSSLNVKTEELVPNAGQFCDNHSRIIFGDPDSVVSDPENCAGILAIGGFCGDATAKKVVNGKSFTEIKEGDIIVNNGWGSCSFWNATNVAEVMTHEVGHTLGLGHSSNPAATMAAFAHFDGRGASITQDDKDGIEFIYPCPTGNCQKPEGGPGTDPLPGEGSAVIDFYQTKNSGKPAKDAFTVRGRILYGLNIYEIFSSDLKFETESFKVPNSISGKIFSGYAKVNRRGTILTYSTKNERLRLKRIEPRRGLPYIQFSYTKKNYDFGEGNLAIPFNEFKVTLANRFYEVGFPTCKEKATRTTYSVTCKP